MLVQQWQAVQGRREFLAAFRESVGDVAEDSSLGEWLRWAERYIEMSDPLTRFRERKATITVYYSGYGHEIANIRTQGFKDEAPSAVHGQKPKAPGVPLADVPETDGWGKDALELVLPEDLILPYEITEPGFVPRRFGVPARTLNQVVSASILEGRSQTP